MQKIDYDEAWFLGGGAGAGFIYLGLMEAAEKLGIDTNNIFLTGTSIGSFFVRALAEKMKYQEARIKLGAVGESISRIMIPKISEIRNSITHKRDGFENPKKLEDIAGELFGEKTFKDFPNLNILVSDYETEEIIEMNRETYPDLPVKKAIAASAAIQPVFFPYTLDYGERIKLKDGGDSYENPINKVIPVGYKGRIFSINLMDGHRLLQKVGSAYRNGNNGPEPYRSELDITEMTPKIPFTRFFRTDQKNIDSLYEQGYPEFMKALTGYLSKSIPQSKPF